MAEHRDNMWPCQLSLHTVHSGYSNLSGQHTTAFIFHEATSWTTGVLFPRGAIMGFFLIATASRLVLGPTQPSIQFVRRLFPTGVKAAGGVKLTTHLHLVPRLRMRGYIHPLPHTSSWGGAYLRTRITLPLHCLFYVFNKQKYYY